MAESEGLTAVPTDEEEQSPSATFVSADADAATALNPLSNSSSPDKECEDDSFLMTLSNCYLSHNATLHGASNIEFKGRSVVESGCVVHGDSGSVLRIGRYVWIRSNTVLEPPKTDDGKPIPVTIGSHTHIDKNCVIRAAAIGSFCSIGQRVRLGQRVIVKDCCVILDDVVLGDDTVIPPFTLVSKASPLRASSGNEPSVPLASYAPSFFCTELPPSTSSEMQERSIELYAEFSEVQARR